MTSMRSVPAIAILEARIGPTQALIRRERPCATLTCEADASKGPTRARTRRRSQRAGMAISPREHRVGPSVEANENFSPTSVHDLEQFSGRKLFLGTQRAKCRADVQRLVRSRLLAAGGFGTFLGKRRRRTCLTRARQESCLD